MTWKISKGLAKLMYPPACCMCGRLIEEEGACDDCIKRLSQVEYPCCLKCGKELEDEDAALCRDCMAKQRSFVRGYPLYNYISPVSEALASFKYEAHQEYAEFFGMQMVKRYRGEYMKIAPDAVIPVPVYKKRLMKRGFNQAELLAEVICRETGLTLDTETLVRSEDTHTQKQLGNEERERNLRNAFSATKRAGNCVLLVDDIYTTGATIESMEQKQQ